MGRDQNTNSKKIDQVHQHHTIKTLCMENLVCKILSEKQLKICRNQMGQITKNPKEK